MLESVYEEAVAHEFSLRGIPYEKQKEIYLKKDVGKHRVNLLVESEIVLELKTVESMHKIFEAQMLTYLRATSKRVGLLLNFNVERLIEGIKRLILWEHGGGERTKEA